MKKVNVLVIGGGINGAGIARDVAGRGLSVMLCEKDDLACATSSASTKLIHGGLRYLEYFKLGLVHSSLKEREILLNSAPHIIWPLTFILPHHDKLRPRWLIRLGLFLYDNLGGRKILAASKGHNLLGTALGQPLKSTFSYAFSYADCWVEDTRLVVLSALDAAEKGAEIFTRMSCIGQVKNKDGKGWIATLQDEITGQQFLVQADMIVNATGPWVNKTLDQSESVTRKHDIRWVKGSHVILPRLYHGKQAYILQNDDGRVVFVIPYEDKYSLVGTTDIEYTGDIEEVRVDIEEVEYLCTAVSRYFRHTIKPEHVEWTFSGVRPLIDDGKKSASAVTRDYVLDFVDIGDAPILSVYGGKLTTYRKLSEKVGNKVVSTLGRGGKAWTEKAHLPGAELMPDFTAFYKTLRREYNWLPERLSYRLARSYGTRVRDVLRGCKRLSDMGEHLGGGLYEAEVGYLFNVEWALTADDILWRRSKLGLHVAEDTEAKVEKVLDGLKQQKEQTA